MATPIMCTTPGDIIKGAVSMASHNATAGNNAIQAIKGLATAQVGIDGKGGNYKIADLAENDKLYGGNGNHQLACDEGVDLYIEISSLTNLLLRLKSP